MESSPNRHADLHSAELIEIALANQEGYLNHTGAFCTATGLRTGRSPLDRFLVDENSSNDLIDWNELNLPFSAEAFDLLWEKVEDHILQNDHYINHLEVGNHPDHYIPIKVTTATAWHSLFARSIFICPKQFNTKGKQVWKVLHAPNFICEPELDSTHSDGAVIIHFAQRRIIVAGMPYAGELKQALFSVQNFLLPEKDVLPMHCAANIGESGDVTVFLGASGAGKTTLSTTDSERFILGDDEHGWSKGSIFSLEDGCYTKTINLSKQKEPAIWNAIRFGAILENVAHNSYTREPDYDDTRLSENGRCSFPLNYLEKRINPAKTGEPKHIVLLICDRFGVFPPVAKLSAEAAAFYFLSGYTTKINSEQKITPEFSACFGSDFMPRSAHKYAKLLMKRITECECDIYLVNTGWSGDGETEEGERLPIQTTRNIIRAIQGNELKTVKTNKLPVLNLEIPEKIAGIDSRLLNPKNTWQDKNKYDNQAQYLAKLFIKNIESHNTKIEIIQAGPTL